MEAFQLPIKPPYSNAIMDEDPPYMGCLNLPGPVPLTLCSNPAPTHRMPAIFSTRLGTLPVRYLPLGVTTPVVIRSNPPGDILYAAEKYAAEHPEAVNKMDFMPTSYQSLYQYFDPYDLWVQGPEFLFKVVHRLAWHTLAKKRRFDRLVTTWCANNIPKLAQLPFVGSPVKMLLDAEDWYYFGFSHISEHDMNLICYKLDRAAYDIKPQVDQYKEFRAAPTPAPITPISPIKQDKDNTHSAAVAFAPSLAAIASRDAQEHNGTRSPSHETHADLPTALSNRNARGARGIIPSGPPGGTTQKALTQEIHVQGLMVSTPIQTELSLTNVSLNAPAAMGLEQSRVTLQRGSSGYSIDTTVAELREDESERIPRVALPGQLNRPLAMPDFQRQFNVHEIYRRDVDYNAAASEGRLISIRLTDTYDVASRLKSDLIPKVFTACGEIESYRPYPAHAEMTFYLPECATKAAKKLNNQRILGSGPTLMVIPVQSFDNSPLPGSTIGYNNQDSVVGRRNFSLQDAKVNQRPAGRSSVNTGSSWATAPEFTPRATPVQTPVSIPPFRPTAGGTGLCYEQNPETMTGQFRGTLPVVRRRSPQELMPTMQFVLGRVPSTPLPGTPMGQSATLSYGYPSTPLVSTLARPSAGPPSRHPSPKDYSHAGAPFRPKRRTRRPNQPPYGNRPNGYQSAPRAGFGKGGLPRTTNTPAKNHSTPHMDFRNSGPPPPTNTPIQRQTSWKHQQDRPRTVAEAEQRAIPVNNSQVGVLYNPVFDCPLPLNRQGEWIRAASLPGPVLHNVFQAQPRRDTEPGLYAEPVADTTTSTQIVSSNVQTPAAVATLHSRHEEPHETLARHPSPDDRHPEAKAQLFVDGTTPPSGTSSNNDADALRSILECVTAPVAEEAAAAAMGRPISHVSEGDVQAIRGLLESVTAPQPDATVAAPTTEFPKSRSITRLEEIEGASVAATLSEEQRQTRADDVKVSAGDIKISDAVKANIRPGFETWKAKAIKNSSASGDEKADATRTRTGSDSSTRGNRASGLRDGKKNRKTGRGGRHLQGGGIVLSPTGWPSLAGGPSMQLGENEVSSRPPVLRTTSGRRNSMAAVASKAKSVLDFGGESLVSSQSNSGATKRVRPHPAAGRRIERREKGERMAEWNGKKLSMASEWEVETRGGIRLGGKRRESPLRREDWRGKGKEGERVEEW